MAFLRTLHFVFLLYAVNSGESRILKNDLSLKEKISLAPLGGKDVNHVPSNHVKRSNGGASYSQAVDNLYNTLFPTDRSCVQTAEQKSNAFPNTGADFQKAIQLVNIYTQANCYAYIGNAAPQQSLYVTLNARLRSGQPEEHWKEMAALLSKGLEILGSKVFPNLYRGGYFEAANVGTQITLKQFLSTSRSVAVALMYASTKSFIHLKNVRGADISQYSQFPHEEEVLIPPGINLTVDQLETDIKRIRQEINKISPAADVPNDIQQYVVLSGSG